jgi:hypothetical protein
VLAALGVVVVVVYLVIVDLGISAGRIHHGVRVAGVDIGGLTVGEAADALKLRAQLMRKTPVLFRSDGLEVTLVPKDVHWQPRPSKTAFAAMKVGRKDGPVRALLARLRCWFGGVTMAWKGHAGPVRLTHFIDDVEARGAALGLRIDRARFRQEIRRGLLAWPRRPGTIPLASGQA